MKTAAAYSSGPWKAPKDASPFENPPVDKVVNAWISASNPDMPSAR